MHKLPRHLHHIPIEDVLQILKHYCYKTNFKRLQKINY